MKSHLVLLIVLASAIAPAAPTPFRSRLPVPPPPPRSAVRSSSPSGPIVECYMTLVGAATCLDFVTDTTSAPPPAQCCEGVRTILNSPGIVCLCHVLGREIEGFYTDRPPINRLRVALLPLQCGIILPFRAYTMCITERVPPIRVNPPPPPSPSSGGGHA